MKKIIYVLLISLVVAGGLIFAQKTSKNEAAKKVDSKPLSAAEIKAARQNWETTPGGIYYKKWEASPEGKKVLADAAKLSIATRDYTNMEGVVTSLSLPPGSKLGLGLMVQINGTDYILAFGAENAGSKELEQLQSLKVADKIIIKSHGVSHAPKYTYPIVAGDYIERDNKIIYQRVFRKGGC
jgi:hypothetical protein